MKIETLVVTVDQRDNSLVYKMNIQTDAIVGNQGDYTSTDEFCLNGHQIVYLNTTERGVGRNRNLVLQHAAADICILADDDMRFVDGYPQIAMKAFHQCPDADILIFNLLEKQPKRFVNKKVQRIKWNNYARYGAARLAVCPKKLRDAGITFSELFGGGAIYGSGEDTIFLKECLDKGLRLYAVPFALAEMDQDAQSTWFHGYNKKFFYDKGALYCALYPRMKWVCCLRYILKYRNNFAGQYRMPDALKAMLEGAKSYEQQKYEDEHIKE